MHDPYKAEQRVERGVLYVFNAAMFGVLIASIYFRDWFVAIVFIMSVFCNGFIAIGLSKNRGKSFTELSKGLAG
jgi:hypothetical protein